MRAASVTAVILTKDEAAALPRALGSLPPGMPALVLDAESTDATPRIAEAFGARAIVRPWAGFVAARRYALGEVRTPWTLMLDADESLDAALREALAALPEEPREDGFRLARTTSLCGRPVRGCGWGDERLLRLFRTAEARLAAHPAAGGAADLHERWEVDGPVADLGGRLAHDSYPTLAAYGSKFARYTTIEAAALHARAPGAAFAAALARAALRLPWLFFGRAGWRDGWRGAFVSAASAVYPVVVRWKALAYREGRLR